MKAPPAIRLLVNNLAAARGSRVIFRGLNLEAGAGEAVTLVGPNGSGKTTCLMTKGVSASSAIISAI
jgi:ABC-type transport system involved in cytochrome c biogenesis ATPase subunit